MSNKKVIGTNLIETQIAIKIIKDFFEKELSRKLSLIRVSAPLFVFKSSGLNDELSGNELPISFKAKALDEDVEIVQSLAKWKRYALKKYDFKYGQGIYTDMNAVRKDEVLDEIHSLYIDQWDWEKIILSTDRNIGYLKRIVRKIYHCLYKTEQKINSIYGDLTTKLPKKITFITSNKLLSLYPELSPKEREYEICKLHRAVFILKIGAKLKNNLVHDTRAADYDDWKLNGDLLVFDDLIDGPLELSSMGIRVDKERLIKQLKIKKEEYKLDNFYCQGIINNEFPLTIGGGIGQSRLCMFFLDKKHIGEVQSSIWNQKDIDEALSLGLKIL